MDFWNDYQAIHDFVKESSGKVPVLDWNGKIKYVTTSNSDRHSSSSN